MYISVYIRLCFIQKTKHIDLSINSCIHVYVACVCMYVCVSICVSELKWTYKHLCLENHLVVHGCTFNHVCELVTWQIPYIHLFIGIYILYIDREMRVLAVCVRGLGKYIARKVIQYFYEIFSFLIVVKRFGHLKRS